MCASETRLPPPHWEHDFLLITLHLPQTRPFYFSHLDSITDPPWLCFLCFNVPVCAFMTWLSRSSLLSKHFLTLFPVTSSLSLSHSPTHSPHLSFIFLSLPLIIYFHYTFHPFPASISYSTLSSLPPLSTTLTSSPPASPHNPPSTIHYPYPSIPLRSHFRLARTNYSKNITGSEFSPHLQHPTSLSPTHSPREKEREGGRGNRNTF